MVGLNLIGNIIRLVLRTHFYLQVVRRDITSAINGISHILLKIWNHRLHSQKMVDAVGIKRDHEWELKNTESLSKVVNDLLVKWGLANSKFVVGHCSWKGLLAFFKTSSQSVRYTICYRSRDFVWENEGTLKNLSMKSFRFRIGVTQFNKPADLIRVTRIVRAISAKYLQFEVYSYQMSRSIADQVFIKWRSNYKFHSPQLVI